MPEYRRAYIPGATYFFTVATHCRQHLLTDQRCRESLRNAINRVRSGMPFEIAAWVLMPDHLHAVWQLPPDDKDFSLRWSLIKQHVTRDCVMWLPQQNPSPLRERRGEGGLWQPRFWEHLVRDELDFSRHLDYIHYNPVKHGYVSNVAEWPYSTFHRYVKQGVYPVDWGGAVEMKDGEIFGE
ncbi:MAG: REP-associated tyrosine transposase [Gallionellaceae bacterium]